MQGIMKTNEENYIKQRFETKLQQAMAIKLFVYEMSLAVWTHKHTGMDEFVSELTLCPHI